MSLVRFKYLLDNGIVNDRMALARAIERCDFPKPIVIGENTVAWHLCEIEEWLANTNRPKS